MSVYPYTVSVGIVDTKIWEVSVASEFYIEVKDSIGRMSNVTISVTRSACDQSEETDKDFSLRANFRVTKLRVTEFRLIFRPSHSN